MACSSILPASSFEILKRINMKPKVIILYNQLFHYRIPVWNCLAEKCDLTVTYSQGDGKIPEGMECKFKIMHLPAYTLMHRAHIQKANIRKLVKNYDAIIAYGDITWLPQKVRLTYLHSVTTLTWNPVFDFLLRFRHQNHHHHLTNVESE